MSGKIEFFPLQPNLRIKIVKEPFSVSPEIERAVDLVWQEESAKKPLFNGQVLIVKEFSETEITTQYAQYKYLIAQKLTHIKPFGVSGVIRAGEYILIGARSQTVATFAGYFETVPSGSVDGESFLDVLYKELEEETRIMREEILNHKVLGLFFCKKSMIYDIGVLLEASQELAKRVLQSTREYEKLFWIYPRDLQQYSPLVPLSLELVKLLKSL